MIALAFIVSAVLALGAAALVPERLPGAVRLLAIAVAPTAAVGVWAAVHAFQGWPLAAKSPPGGAVFVSADVHEPDWIYLWLEPHGSSRPRAYRIRYSDGLYEEVLRAQKQVKSGNTVTVQKAGGKSKRGNRRRHTGTPLPSFDLRVYHEPPLTPPVKTH